jgi:16S rRNA (cytosine1402-N4)-methyltransferase
MPSEYHIPVLLNECIEALQIDATGTYADVTFGGGGHSRAILDRLDTGRLIAFDKDEDAWRQAPEDPRFTLVREDFRHLAVSLQRLEAGPLDGLLADLGVSSHQVDTPGRGFSFMHGGVPDMRMSAGTARTALDILNTYQKERLKRIFRTYGDITQAGRLAGAIERARRKAPFATVQDLLEAARPFAPRGAEHRFFARVFQALRIEVNDEMGALRALLEQATGAIRAGGRLCVISYHSLEDRMVKRFIRSGNVEGETQKDLYGHSLAPFRAVGRSIVPGAKEIASNPRARSARLRVAERTDV